jgi:hypothetical protein
MPDYLLLMHDDAPEAADDEGGDEWAGYVGALQRSGNFQGGSAIGDGVCVRKAGDAPAIARHIVGYVRISAASLEQARLLLAGNPVYESGGTVEIRERPRTD